MDRATGKDDFDERRWFDDRPADDREAGPARAVDISGRCSDCWGRITGTKEAAGRWLHIECLVCGRAVDGEDAAREADAMQREAGDQMAAARVGRPANYRVGACFVLKLLPDMDRDKAKMDRRVEASLKEGRKRRRLTRHEIPPGTAGYLYAQARALVAGVDNLSGEKSAVALSDFEYGEPQEMAVERSPGDGNVQVKGRVPVVHRKPSGCELMERMPGQSPRRHGRFVPAPRGLPLRSRSIARSTIRRSPVEEGLAATHNPPPTPQPAAGATPRADRYAKTAF